MIIHKFIRVVEVLSEISDHGITTSIGDFLVVAIIAAAMSSLDSVLLVAASVVTRDIRMELAPVTDAGAVAWTRGGIIAFAALAALIALNPPGDEIAIFSGSLYAVYFAPAVLFGRHWRRGSATAALAGGAVGGAARLAWVGRCACTRRSRRWRPRRWSV